MEKTSPLVIISGTNRPGANTRKVAERVFALVEKRLAHAEQVKASLIDLAEFNADFYAPRAYEEKPRWFLDRYQSQISAACGLIVVTPEYNGSFPGVLKYFIDMLEFPQSLKGVPTTFVGVAAGQFGAMRSIEQLSQIFSYRGAHIYGDRLFLPQIHSVLQQEKGDAGWSVGQHEERLQKLVDGFVTFVLANKT